MHENALKKEGGDFLEMGFRIDGHLNEDSVMGEAQLGRCDLKHIAG